MRRHYVATSLIILLDAVHIITLSMIILLLLRALSASCLLSCLPRQRADARARWRGAQRPQDAEMRERPARCDIMRARCCPRADAVADASRDRRL